MQYPLISEYVKAIQDACDNLEQLAYLTPVLDDHGDPYRSSGAFAVVFKMQDKSTGKYYSQDTGVLEHSFTKLSDFSNPPRLVSCKDPLEEEGFSCGDFYLDESSVVFAASDALSHYIMMMYELSKSKEYGAELAEEYLKASGNSQLLKTAETMKFEFGQDVLQSLLDATSSDSLFEQYLKKLNSEGILDLDDFTLVYFKG